MVLLIELGLLAVVVVVVAGFADDGQHGLRFRIEIRDLCWIFVFHQHQNHSPFSVRWNDVVHARRDQQGDSEERTRIALTSRNVTATKTPFIF